MKPKHLARRIVFASLAIVLTAVTIVANVLLDKYSLILHRFVAGDSATVGKDASDALENSDNVVRTAAEESMVLLENKDDYLPLRGLTKVNLFGYGSTDAGFLLTGGGSGGTSITDEKAVKIDLTDAFKDAGIEYNKNLISAYEAFSTFDADWRSGGSTGAKATESLLNPDADFYSASRMDEAYAYSHVAVVTLSRWGCENGGDKELVDIGKYLNGTFLELTAEEKAMLDALENKNFEVIVLLNTCNNMELGFVKDYSSIKACIYVGIPGQSGASAIPKIINGTINPSGKISDTLPYDHQTYDPVYANAFKGDSGIAYQEGIYFGYKWYETADAEGYFDSVSNSYGNGYDGVVQYPFGYGLSYTKFSWKITSKPTTLTTDGKTEHLVKVKVTNVGDVAGRDVVQLYGHAPYTAGGIEKPERILLDFAKTPTLYPSSQKDATHPDWCEVELKFTAYDLASYDDYDKNRNGFTGYELEKGDHVISVMTDSHNKNDDLSFTLKTDSGKTFATDPKTDAEVKNQFTGNTAYAGCPTDGGVEYLSRANNFANFPTARANINAPKASSAKNYVYDGYNSKDVSAYSFNNNLGIYLVQSETTDGEKTMLGRASMEMLEGKDTSVALKYNTAILECLADYDHEFWDYLLNQMSEEELKSLIGLGGFQTAAVYSIGKPRCTDKDGPAGFNNNVTNPGKSSVYTLLPSEALIGCSFDKDLAASIGESQATEGNEFGVNGWYGPGVNLHRSVFNSRNYEYFSEDATLSGKLAASLVSAAKKNNLYCYVKHFAVSEAGQNPKEVNTWLTEQALRENYLKAFEITVKEGGANAIMSAFNNVGAVLSGYNHALLTSVLREEWGFKGSVITDWYMGSGYMSDHTKGVLAGNDLWLCGTTAKPAELDLTDDAVLYAARRSAKNILYTFIDTNTQKQSVKINAEAHSTLVDILWIGVDVILGAGIVACVLLAIFVPKKKARAETSYETSDETSYETSDGSSHETPDGSFAEEEPEIKLNNE